MGYKVSMLLFIILNLYSYIWTVWVIKVAEKFQEERVSEKLHLNRVGYKVEFCKVVIYHFFKLHLNRVGYKGTFV